MGNSHQPLELAGHALAAQKAQARRNRWLAVGLLLLACGFYAAFFWSMSHKGG